MIFIKKLSEEAQETRVCVHDKQLMVGMNKDGGNWFPWGENLVSPHSLKGRPVAQVCARMQILVALQIPFSSSLCTFISIDSENSLFGMPLPIQLKIIVNLHQCVMSSAGI